MKKHNILVVSGYFPFPPLDGGTVDIWKRIEGLKSLNQNIDLIYTDKKEPSKELKDKISKYINTQFFVRRENQLGQLFNIEPLQVTSRQKLRKLQLINTYDFIILESEYVAEILKNNTLKGKRIILRSHNNEEIYFKNLALSTRHIFKKIFYVIESYKFRFYSKKIYNKVNDIWFISKKEKLEANLKKGIVVPPPVELSEMKQQSLNTKNVLFIGSLFMENNIEGLLWYLKHVHKELIELYRDYKLIIAGSTRNCNEKQLENRFNLYPKVELYLNQDNLDYLYSKSIIFINPMLHGAGVKVKSINAILNGLPLISTTIGSEGIGLIKDKYFLLANTASEFKKCIIAIFESEVDKENLVKQAQQFLKDNHYLKILRQELN